MFWRNLIVSAATLSATSPRLAQAIADHHPPPPEHRAGEHHASLPQIPNIGLGTWLSDRDKVAHAVQYALDGGYRHVDAALIYRNEDKVGEGIAASNVPRQDIWVTSKLWNTDHRPENVHRAIDKTLSDLGVGYLDLYLMHWPVAFIPGSNYLDTETSIEDTWQAMEDLVRQRKTRFIGVSNFSPDDLDRILAVCSICPYAHEFETHPYLQQQDFVDRHLDMGIDVIAYSPLGNTNPQYGGGGVPALLDDPFWSALAATKNITVAQAVLAWGRQRGTIVIPKSVHEAYIDQNLESRGVALTEEDMSEIARQDKKSRFNNPGRSWGVDLFRGLDDPTYMEDEEPEL